MRAIFAILFSLGTLASAQETAAPQLRGSDPAPMLNSAPLLPAPEEGIGLIPETLEPVPKPKAGEFEPMLPTEPQRIDKTTAAEDEMNARIRFRELKTKVEREAKVVGELDRAKTAKTDYGKREAMKAYYHALYDRVAKLDPSLKKRATEVRDRMIRRMAQTRVAPTEPYQGGEQ